VDTLAPFRRAHVTEEEPLMALQFGPRRGRSFDVLVEMRGALAPLAPEELEHFEAFDLVYRSLVAVLYNYVPTSGHPGGSISSGRFVAGILFDALDYDFSRPEREDADIVSYAAGHKALGLYALWALRDEIVRIAAPELLPDDRQRLRLEDLLGFRRNPTAGTPLFRRFHAKALDGHPTPATPFVRLSTGASGVGVGASLGLALGARDFFGPSAPRVHIVEGEGGLTPGRVAEAIAAAGTASLDNAILHLDWNQASIDSNHVCREADVPGDYVQWDPVELFHLHDWNVILVPNGMDLQQVVAAQRLARKLETSQPTAVVYRTVKGWQYGIEGRASHGAGHGLCSDGFFAALRPLVGDRDVALPTCCGLDAQRCKGSDGAAVMEECLWEALQVVRSEIERRRPMAEFLARKLVAARQRLDRRARRPRGGAPLVDAVYEVAARDGGGIPASLRLAPGTVTTLRGELGRVLLHYNQASNGAFFVSAADLLGSTSINKAAEGFPSGYYNATKNAESRLLSVGGICEDAMAGYASGLGSFGHHIGVASSYAAFIAPLGHVAARLHAIGNQARHATTGAPYRPMILVAAHAGLKTGEDGPTHADPQALQLLQENFPPGTAVTLTPWEPQEIWVLVTAALAARPALIAPFVTRPNETVPDRGKLGLAPATAAATGVYRLRAARSPKPEAVLVLQESAVTLVFATEVLPRLDREGIDVDVYYVASAELFDALGAAEREGILPDALAQQAMGITGFTLPTMYRWITSERGRAATLHPYRNGHYPGSGQGPAVLAEAGLDAEGQYRAVREYLDVRARRR
jgi:transketolase